MKMQFSFVIFYFALLGCIQSERRSKRFLIFPLTAPTRAQLIYGVGIPLELEMESMTTGYVLKTEYFLPTKAEELRPTQLTPMNIGKRSLLQEDLENNTRQNEIIQEEVIDPLTKRKYMKYYQKVKEINSSTLELKSHQIEELENESRFVLEDKFKNVDLDERYEHLDQYRWLLYNSIEMMANTMNIPGKSCMLRVICESAEIPFHFENGLLGEILHIILTPSSSKDSIEYHSDNEYYRAELLGRSGAPCHRLFKECKISLLAKISALI